MVRSSDTKRDPTCKKRTLLSLVHWTEDDILGVECRAGNDGRHCESVRGSVRGDRCESVLEK